MVDFGQKLKELRVKSGLTQKELAERLWVTKATISYYEQSERTPSPEMLVKIAREFHVSADCLLGLEDNRRYLDVTDLEEEDIDLLQHMIQRLSQKGITREKGPARE